MTRLTIYCLLFITYVSKTKIVIIIIVVILVLVAGIVLSFERKARTAQLQSGADPVAVEILENSDHEAIVRALVESGALRENLKSIFNYYVLTRNLENELRAGQYLISPSVSPSAIANKLSRGEIIKEVKITLIEGWTAGEMGEKLEERGIVKKSDFLLAVDNNWSDEFKWLGDVESVRGFLFPDTYRFYLESDGYGVVRKMLKNFETKALPKLKDSNMKFSLYEVMTLASIVQNEVGNANDMKTVAGIFLSRLALDKALESDATVNYATNKSELQPSFSDLATDSPYNTYRAKGLPPTPIGNPGIEAIEAVVDPLESDYLYFLTTKDGETIFSTTFEEHLSNKAMYLD